MRHVSRGLLACLLICGSVLADERAPSSSSAAEEVRLAWAEGKMYRLAALARRDVPDPWRVADELCRLGAQDAALAFARAAVRPDTAGLAAYLEKRGDRAPDQEVRDAVRAAETAKTPEAVEAALETVDALVGRGDVFEQARLEVARANALSELDRYEEAAEAFLSAGRIAERLGWLSLAAAAYGVSGDAAYRCSNRAAMLTAWESRLGVEQGRENDEGMAEALMLVGLVHVELADSELGHQYLLESLAANEAIGNDDGVAWVLNNLATLYHRRGQHHLEQAALDRSLRLAREVGNKTRIAAVLCDQGALHCTLRDNERSRELLRQAMTVFQELGDEAGVMDCLGNMALTLFRDGEHDKAIEYYEDVVAFYRETKDQEFLCGALNSLGYVYFEKGDLKRALPLLEEAVDLGDGLSDPWWGAHARQSLAEALLELKRFAEAKEHLDRSMNVARKLASPLLLMVAHRGLAEMWLEKGQYRRAVHESQRAMEHAQDLLSGLAHVQAAQIRDSATPVYDIALRAAVAWGRPADVFTAMESARAGALLEALENRDEIRAVRIPEALRQQEREAKLAVLAALREYQKAVESGERRKARKRRAVLEEARKRASEVVGQIQRVAKKPASVLYPQAATLEDLQEKLEPHEAMVLFSLVGDDAQALVVTWEAARTVSLGPSDAIAAAASSRPEDPHTSYEERTAALHAKLVEPLKLGKETERLLVSPDGVLGFTPFALLVPEVEVVYVPSGSAYRVLSDAQHGAGQGVLALGDPEYGRPRPRGTGTEIAVRGGMRLVPLPATRAEAEGVGDVVLLGERATKSALLAALKERERWEAVHFACHGLVDPARPTRSALALAFEEDGSNLLPCEEVFTLDIPADLTVLSACDTGRGAVYRSEGIVGLAQAFMLAGSPRVLVSLWKVDDEATQALMLEFYAAWRPKDGKPGISAAAALEQAQAHVRSQAKWKHPYYWAAWVLWGLP